MGFINQIFGVGEGRKLKELLLQANGAGTREWSMSQVSGMSLGQTAK